MPGDGDDDGTTPSVIIYHRHNSRNSIRSALRSPELFDPSDRAGFGVVEEDEEAAVVSQGEGILSEEPGEIIEAQQQEEKGIHASRGEEISEATKLLAQKEGKGKSSKK